MSMPRLVVLTLSLALACSVHAATKPSARRAPAKPLSMQELLDTSRPSDWRRLDPQNTLLLELADGHRVVIELAPSFAPAHVANIRTLAHEGYWNGLSINRSQDNFVVQWGDAEENAARRRPLGTAKAKLPAEFAFRRGNAGTFDWARLPDADGWAPQVGFLGGFPAGHDPKSGTYWMAHCYGAVGAGRNNEADSSDGSELYVVTGQSPRQLDRNMSMVGRVVQGMEWLSTIPRGTGPLGFFEKPEQRVVIRSLRLAADVPAAERPAIEVLRTGTPRFAQLVEARRNRRDEFYKVQAHHIDLCNVPLPVRDIKP
ncbi:MAG: peptidylprolyl isomerase [Lysobacter sp.]|nr:MAG: peptidylprolyl isomerase [Lysobacter sp.]